MTFGFSDGLKLPRSHILTDEHYQSLKCDKAIAAHAKRLALELECLLLECKDMAAVSKWWDSAHQALDDYQKDVDRYYPKYHVSPLGK